MKEKIGRRVSTIFVVLGGVVLRVKEKERETERENKRVGIVERSSNDAIRRVMQNDVTLQAGVTVLSQGQSVQGPTITLCHSSPFCPDTSLIAPPSSSLNPPLDAFFS